jgi:hypothetical protein
METTHNGDECDLSLLSLPITCEALNMMTRMWGFQWKPQMNLN